LLRELDSQLPAASFVFDAPDEEEAQVAQRFNRRQFGLQALSTPFTVLAHLGAIRPPEGLRLYSTDPVAKDCPFDPAWLTLPELVSTAWSVNVPNPAAANAGQVSNYLLTRHRLARFAGPVPGSFYPNFNSEFFLHSLVGAYAEKNEQLGRGSSSGLSLGTERLIRHGATQCQLRSEPSISPLSCRRVLRAIFHFILLVLAL
jgi:hypothetical protein